MRFREPLLGGSAAMPGASLQRACRLLVAVCALHLGVTLVYYLAGRDLSLLPRLIGVPTPVQGSSAAASGQPPGEPRPGGPRPPPPSDASAQPRPGRDSSPGVYPDPGPASNLTSVPASPATASSLPACPEESPLLGKDSARAGPRAGTPRASRTRVARTPPSRPAGLPAFPLGIRVLNPKERPRSSCRLRPLPYREAGWPLWPQEPEEALETSLLWPRKF